MALPTDACYVCLGARSFTVNTCTHAAHDACLLRASRFNIFTCGLCRQPVAALLPAGQQAIPLGPPPVLIGVGAGLMPPPPPPTSIPALRAPPDDALPTQTQTGTADVDIEFIQEGFSLSHARPFDVVARIKVGPLTGPSTSIDLVALLDVSGSMYGDKINMLKRSMLALLDELGPTDRLALVPFHSAATCTQPLKLMTDDQKALTGRYLASLKEGGGTNIGGALGWAEALLDQRVHRNSVAGVLLISDGRDENNFQSARAAGIANKYPVYSIGIGSDHDSNMLGGLARLGAGSFSYAESPEAIPGSIGRTVGILKTVVATNGTVFFGDDAKSVGMFFADMTKSYLFSWLAGMDSAEAGLSYRSLGGGTNRETHSLALGSVGFQTATNLIFIDSVRNRDRITKAIEVAGNLTLSGAKELLEHAKAEVAASISADMPETLHLLGQIDTVLAKLATRNDRATLENAYSLMATQTGGPLGETPSMVAAHQRMTEATQIL